MPRWISAGILIAYPCLMALLVYDGLAVVVLVKGPYPVVPRHSMTYSLNGLIGDNAVTASSVAAWTVEKSATRQTTLSFEIAYRGFKDKLSPRLSNEDLSGVMRLEIKGF